MNTDVLIAGAGPAGLTMAAELARYGVSVRIVDKAPQRTDKSKALVIWSRTLEFMDRMGYTAEFLAAGHKVSAANINAGNKQVAHVTLSGVATPHPYALMVPQSETERLLEKHLTAYGVQVERSVELKAFSQGEGGVSSTFVHAGGREEKLDTSWLIGCDGAHSTVRHQLGMAFLGDTLPSDWMLADVHLTGVRTADQVDVAWHADGVMAIFAYVERPLSLGRRCWKLSRRGPGGIVLPNRFGSRCFASTSAKSPTIARAVHSSRAMPLIFTVPPAARE